jgi:glycosyltransferase involved in cell wall biosynthesis
MWGNVRALLAGASRRAPCTTRRPTLSVVLPAYDVERYLPTCLESVLGQSFRDLEVVIVVDGATDSSLQIAHTYAGADRRVRVHYQENSGLGAARNTGVRLARGRYLAFVDSDDTLPPDAYELLVTTIERTGSELVSGTLSRTDGDHHHVPPLMQLNHRWRRERTCLAEVPLMLADVFPVNKVFRRDFWDAAGLSFPHGTRYEDQPTLTAAFLRATTIDIIPEVVYHWWNRRDHASITKGRRHLVDLEDRIRTKQQSTDLVASSGRPELLDVWYKDVLPVDMWEYFRVAPQASDTYWETLRTGMRSLWNETTCTFDHTRVPAQQRLMGWLVEHDRRDELAELVAFIDRHGGDVPLEMRHDHVVADLPGTGSHSAGPPASTFVLGEHEHRWEGRVTSIQWEDSELHIEGFALIRNAPTTDGDTELVGTLRAVSDDHHDPLPLDLKIKPETLATAFVGRPSQNFDHCGFRLSVDLADLPEVSGRWRFDLRRRVHGIYAGGGMSHLHGCVHDDAWHEVAGAAHPTRARLSEVEGDLVLDVDVDRRATSMPDITPHR